MSSFFVDGRYAINRGTSPLAFRNTNTAYRGALQLFFGTPLQPLVPPIGPTTPTAGGGGLRDERPGPSSFTRADLNRVERLKRIRRELRREIIEAIDGPLEERLPPAPKTETALTERQERAADRQPDLLPARLELARVQVEIIKLEARLRQEARAKEDAKAREEQEMREIISMLMLMDVI